MNWAEKLVCVVVCSVLTTSEVPMTLTCSDSSLLGRSVTWRGVIRPEATSISCLIFAIVGKETSTT